MRPAPGRKKLNVSSNVVNDMIRTLSILRKCFRYVPDDVHQGHHEEEISTLALGPACVPPSHPA